MNAIRVNLLPRAGVVKKIGRSLSAFRPIITTPNPQNISYTIGADLRLSPIKFQASFAKIKGNHVNGHIDIEAICTAHPDRVETFVNKIIIDL